MYTLRIVTETTVDGFTSREVQNISLGKSYTCNLVGSEYYKECKNDLTGEYKNSLSQVVVDSEGITHYIFRNSKDSNKENYYYIMTDEGKTFERLL